MPFIYAILDKKSEEIIYVGSTTRSVQGRFAGNMLRLKDVLPSNIEAEIKTLQWVSKENRFLVEGAYIDLYNEIGYPLLNKANPYCKATLTVQDRVIRLKVMLNHSTFLINEIKEFLNIIIKH